MALTALSEAMATILGSCTMTPDSEEVSLDQALSRFCAQSVSAGMAVPPADNSAMDGYAVCSRDVPAVLTVSQRIPAGSVSQPLEKGTAARIFTGAEMPVGADAVVLQEDTEETDHGIRLPAAQVGQHIRRRGNDIQPEDQLIAAGQFLRPQDIGLLASVGINRIAVFRPLTVAIVTTGDELRDPGSGDLQPGQIFNSNRFSLGAQIRALGMTVVDLGNVPDDPAQIGNMLERAAAVADCIVTAGGVSVGEEDHVRSQIEARGDLALWKLAIKPGKPLAFGTVKGTPIFGLPGNPVSAWITFALVAKSWLIKRQGGAPRAAFRFPVRAAFTAARAGSREEFLRVSLTGQGETMRASAIINQSSGVLSGLSEADAVAVIPAGTTVSPGDVLEVIPLSALLEAGVV
ncbi:molybdopterin molybdotransferase MoeA [Luminiphilus sp.]|nr:molybdopterin molybdotransferase MoeA [Luminiphilus sp.]